MSSYFSNKILKYREQGRLRAEDGRDVHCTVCGYNLRGLPIGRACPECGAVTHRHSVSSSDPLLAGDLDDRRRVRIGLTLIAMCLFIASPLAVWLFIMMAIAGWLRAFDVYLWTGLGLCIVWIAGARLVTGPAMKQFYPHLHWQRLIARWACWLWLIGHGVWMIASMSPWSGTPRGDALYAFSLLVRCAAGVGGVWLGWWLMKLAADAELEIAARRIHLSLWMLPVPTLILATLSDSFPWIALGLIGMVVFIWCWFVFAMGLGVLAMQRHVSWALRIAEDTPDRDRRIEQTRQALQREAEAKVRAVGGNEHRPRK